jgi:type I restriction enzyme S subunit
MTSFDFAMPPLSILTAFDRIVAPLRRLLANIVQENANLRAQRDLVLPKLISGEIDISSARTLVKEAAE